MSCFLLWHFQLENPNNLLSPRFAVTANLPFTRLVELCCAGSNCWCWCWMTTFTTFRGNCQLAIHLSLSAIHDFALFVYDFLFRASFCHLMLFNYSRSYKKKNFCSLTQLKNYETQIKRAFEQLVQAKNKYANQYPRIDSDGKTQMSIKCGFWAHAVSHV